MNYKNDLLPLSLSSRLNVSKSIFPDFKNRRRWPADVYTTSHRIKIQTKNPAFSAQNSLSGHFNPKNALGIDVWSQGHDAEKVEDLAGHTK